MDESNTMPMPTMSRRLISAYAVEEPWKKEHDEVKFCWIVEDSMAWGVRLFRGLCDEEARCQAHALRGQVDADHPFWAEIDESYRDWLGKVENVLSTADRLVGAGHTLKGLEEFRATIEEGRSVIGNAELAEELPSADEMIAGARPENPRPETYTD